ASAWIDWRHRRLAYDELMALDDRLLTDIGLRRTDIPAIFHEKVRRQSIDAEGAAMVAERITAEARFRPSRGAANLASTLNAFGKTAASSEPRHAAALMEGRMVSLHVDIEMLEWRPGSAKYGSVAVHDGKEIIQSAILSDRREQGG